MDKLKRNIQGKLERERTKRHDVNWKSMHDNNLDEVTYIY